MELPEWVAKHKVKGTEVRLFNGRYYLYSISSKWNKDKKRAQKITGSFLGTITQQGLIPPKRRVDQAFSSSSSKEQTESSVNLAPHQSLPDGSDSIVVKSYGGAALLKNLSEDFMGTLAEIFPDEHKELIVLAILRLLYQSPLKNMSTLYQSSYLSEMIPHCALSGASLSSFLRLIGGKRGKIVAFMQHFVQGTEYILVDLTYMPSEYEKMYLNTPDYTSTMDYDDQINLLYIYSVDKHYPTYYRIVPGNIHDISALKLSIKEAHVKSATLMCDKGFFSKSTIGKLETNELEYICPLKRNDSLVDSNSLKNRDQKQYTGHFLFSDEVIWYIDRTIEEYNEQAQSLSKRKVITYIHSSLKADEERDYLMRVANKVEGYTQEAFFEKKYTFGTLTIITNILNETSEKLYSLYKGRCQIEESFDAFKSLLADDRTYMQNDQAREAWVFINHISMMLASKLYSLLAEKDLLKKYSLQDLLTHLNLIQKIKVQDKWHTCEITREAQALMESLGISST